MSVSNTNSNYGEFIHQKATESVQVAEASTYVNNILLYILC